MTDTRIADSADRVINAVRDKLDALGHTFHQPPVVIGGMAMEYYGLRASGADIDLVVCDADYQALAQRHPTRRKDIYGDLGVALGRFELWRSIALLGYDFFIHSAIDCGNVRMISFERLLFTRVAAMDAAKYRDDLLLCKEYVYARCRNSAFLREAETHIASYEKSGGVVLGGAYRDHK